MPIPALAPFVPGDVAEFRTYATWQGQEFIQKHYLRMDGDTPSSVEVDSNLVNLQMQAKWQANIAQVCPVDFILRQYWVGKIHSVVRIPGPPVRWLISYTDQNVVLGEAADVGTDTTPQWLPTTDAVTMNRFAAIRSKNWRSSVRQGPLTEADQNVGLLTDAAITEFNTQFELAYLGLMFTPGANVVNPHFCVFSPALAVGKTHDHMEDATQTILEWRASRLVGRQSTRKVRAAGY